MVPELTAIMEALVNELNIKHLPQEQQDEILNNLGEIAMQRALLDIFTALPEEKHEALQKLIAENNEEATQTFLAAEVPSIAEIVRNAVRLTIDEHKRIVTELVTEEAQKAGIPA